MKVCPMTCVPAERVMIPTERSTPSLRISSKVRSKNRRVGGLFNQTA
jgi:hypothetical protein